MKNSKTFRLFISSTFSDFAKERAVLQKKVFSEIKKYCADKGYTFQPIDLRWGVSNEAQLDQKTIELCLNEVRVCKTHPHPNFLIMAGDRYGWVPLPYMIEKNECETLLELMTDDEKESLLSWYQLDLNQLPASYILKRREGRYEQWKEWSGVENYLKEILQAKSIQAFQNKKITEKQKRKYFMSATEAEVEEGIFGYLEQTEFQQKLFKKEKYLSDVDKNNIFGFFRNIERETAKGSIFIGKDYDEAQKFKENVKKVLNFENVLDISTTQKSEDALDELYLGDLEERLLSFLKIKVDAHIKNEKQYSDQEVQQQAQEYFLKEKINNFIGREEILGNIASYISGNDMSPLLLYGTSGIGKSAIMAKAILQARQRQDRKVVFRFVGATTDVSSTQEVLIGIFNDLEIDIRNETERKSGEMLQVDNRPETFEDFSYRVHDRIMGLKKQIVIFIDAVDQFSNSDQLLWLPNKLPENVRIIISALEDEKYVEDSKYFQTLKSKTENILSIPQFEEPEQLLMNLLKVEERTIQDSQKEIFLKQLEAIRSPLYIHIVAQEMKHWKSFDENGILADTQQSSIKEFIKNLTETYHHDKRFVQKVFGYITASGDGLSEDEVVDLLTIDTDFVKEMAPETYHKNETGEFPLVIWTRIYTQLKPFLGTKKEQGKDLLYFSHREFESIVANSDYQKQEHESIIAATQELIKKYQNEGFESNRWGKLYATLMVGYDLKYEDADIQIEYARFVSDNLEDDYWINGFYCLLKQEFFSHNEYNRTKEAISYISSSKIITEILYKENPNRWAEDYITSLMNLANSWSSIGKTSQAIELREKDLEVTEYLYKENPVRWGKDYAGSLENLALSLVDVGKISEAIMLLQQALDIIAPLYKENPDCCVVDYVKILINLSNSLSDNDMTSVAISLQQHVLEIITSLYQKNPDRWAEDYTRSLANLAESLVDIGKTSEANVLQQQALEIITSLYQKNPHRWAEGYAVCLNILARLFIDIGKISEAIVLQQQALGIMNPFYQKNPHRWAKDYTRSLNDLAFSFLNEGNISKAIVLQQQVLEIREALYQKNHDHWAEDYAKSLAKLSNSLADIGKTSEAIALQWQALEIVEPLYQQNPDRWAEGFAVYLLILTRSLIGIGNISEAIVLQQQALEVIKPLYQQNPNRWADGYTESINNLSNLLADKGRVSKAIVPKKKE